MLRLTLRAAAVAAGTTVLIGVTPAISSASGATLDKVKPGYGVVGTVVDLIGTGLTTTTTVTFNGVAAHSPVVVDDTHVQARVPRGATSGPVVVTTADGSPSKRFTVQLPTRATVRKTKGIVVYPHQSTVHARLVSAGTAVRDQPARLQRARIGTSGWHATQPAQRTNRRGVVHWAVHPSRNYAYHVVFRNTHAYLGSTTDRVRVHVRPQVVLRAPAITPTLTDFSVHGRVKPKSAHHGRVTLQQRLDGSWTRVASQKLDDGRFAFTRSLADAGRYAYRVHKPRDASHGSGLSGVAVVQAEQRTLRSGDSGPDVRRLQKRLRHLHYDVGAVNGDFGYDTLHAVVAFQKVQGSSRDGVVGPDVWRRLGDPRRPHLRHPEVTYPSGVEVDLTKQVVYYAVDGRIRRILDASSGGGYTYTGSDGTQQQAITPTGHYSVIRKYDGWETAPLGELYRPAYFRSDGYAIHGSNSVPNYPASHGCVRITVPSADRMWNRFVYGMSVWLYH